MSETEWFKIQRRLEGRCEICGGNLPKHNGVCPVEGEQLLKKLERIDNSVVHIGVEVKKLLEKYKYNV